MSDTAAWVLVVDDDPVNRAMLTRVLEQDGYRVDTATDGRRALERLAEEPFDVVLLDVLMPEMDGLEVLSRITEDDALRHLPVVMITSLDDLETAVRCIEIGADDYLTKPFDPVVLRARVKAGLAKKRLHDLEVQHLAETTRLYRRLEARIEEQMADLVRTGELRRFLPQQVADGLLAGELEAEMEPQRRKVTILFADMVGFTDLAESLEPEELAHVLNEYLREMTALAISNGGTLENSMGDGLLVIYGAPVAKDERVQAMDAVRCALGMRSTVDTLAEELRGRGIPASLQIRVGINTGHCTLGVFGSEIMRAYKAMGFTVNIAARLQAAAEPGTILCGFRTYALVEGRVRAVPREPLSVKGTARPVEAWEILDLVEAGATIGAQGS
jgi:class 3 adenylate cyclase